MNYIRNVLFCRFYRQTDKKIDSKIIFTVISTLSIFCFLLMPFCLEYWTVCIFPKWPSGIQSLLYKTIFVTFFRGRLCSSRQFQLWKLKCFWDNFLKYFEICFHTYGFWLRMISIWHARDLQSNKRHFHPIRLKLQDP